MFYYLVTFGSSSLKMQSETFSDPPQIGTNILLGNIQVAIF